jgi:uncharacterized membrane protein YkgB
MSRRTSGGAKSPEQRDRTRPLELLGLSAGVAVVIGIVVFAAARKIEMALIWTGVSFIVVVVVVAMLVLAANPEAGRRDDDDRPRGHE